MAKKEKKKKQQKEENNKSNLPENFNKLYEEWVKAGKPSRKRKKQ